VNVQILADKKEIKELLNSEIRDIQMMQQHFCWERILESGSIKSETKITFNSFACTLSTTTSILCWINATCFSLTTRCFKKELYNFIPNVTVGRVLRKRLHLKAYKLSIVQHLERQQHLEYRCKVLFETPFITSWCFATLYQFKDTNFCTVYLGTDLLLRHWSLQYVSIQNKV
jgi:hypothetical protein